MISFNESKLRLLSSLQASDISSAKEILAEIKSHKASSPLEISERLHLEAKIDLYQGHYLKALNPLQAALIHQPDLLAAHCDLALCHYQLGLYGQLKEILKTTHETLKSHLLHLESQEAVDTAVFVAKMFEEMGQLEDSMSLLESAENLKLSAKQIQALNIQKLRHAIESEDFATAKNLYYTINGGTQHTHNFEIEREHALLLADISLFGVPPALERFKYLIEQNLVQPDIDFISSEMAERLILSNDVETLRSIVLSQNTEVEYERHQARLVRAYINQEQESPLSLIRLEKILSPVSLVRIVRQSLLLFPHSKDIESVKMRYRFYCSQISSKKMQKHFLKILKEHTQDQTFLINYSKKSVTVENREIPLKASLFWKLMPLFKAERKDVSLDEVIQAIYQEQPNLQHFDRVRMGVSRLNASIRASTNIDGLFKVSKTSVTLLHSAKESAL